MDSKFKYKERLTKDDNDNRPLRADSNRTMAVCAVRSSISCKGFHVPP